MDLNVDKIGGLNEKESLYAKNLKLFMKETDLVDIWRIRNPNEKQFSRGDRSRTVFLQSRIDLWLISVALEYQVTSTKIKPGNNSDHSLIKLSFEILETQKRGKGYWKFNNSLLNDQNYTILIKETIQNIKNNIFMENKTVLWDYVKCQIRSETIAYSIRKMKETKLKEKLITNLKTLKKLDCN